MNARNPPRDDAAYLQGAMDMLFVLALFDLLDGGDADWCVRCGALTEDFVAPIEGVRFAMCEGCQ